MTTSLQSTAGACLEATEFSGLSVLSMATRVIAAAFAALDTVWHRSSILEHSAKHLSQVLSGRPSAHLLLSARLSVLCYIYPLALWARICQYLVPLGILLAKQTLLANRREVPDTTLAHNPFSSQLQASVTSEIYRCQVKKLIRPAKIHTASLNNPTSRLPSIQTKWILYSTSGSQP